MAKCWVCGKQAVIGRERDPFGNNIKAPASVPWYRCYCQKCYEETIAKEQEERDTYIKLKKREMFRKACDILEKQNTPMYTFKDAIEAVEEVVEEKPDKFDSSYEVLAAIVLVHNRIYSRMQYKVGRYQVDFLLPEQFVVLEIDGERHKGRKKYDSERDQEIKKILGSHWEIIRINTEYLDKKARVLPVAIKKVLDARDWNRTKWDNNI